MRGRPAAEEQRVHFPRLAQPTQFALQRIEIRLDQIIPAGHQREIAIPAAMPAKRHVDVGGSGRKRLCSCGTPGGTRGKRAFGRLSRS